MQASSLQLDNSAITRLKIEANKSFPKDRAKDRFLHFADAGLESTVELGSDADDPRRFFVKLDMRMLGTEEHPTPYAVDVEIVGIFVCTGSNPNNDEKLAEINGAAVLYGSIREVVLQITSRGPYPPLIMPTVNIIPPEIDLNSDGIKVEGKT